MADEEVENEIPPAKGDGPLVMIVPAILAGAAAFGLAYLDPFSGASSGTSAQAAAIDSSESDHGNEDHVAEEDTERFMMTLEPFVISLQDTAGDGRRTPRLRLGLAVEGNSAFEEPEEAIVLRLRDVVTVVVRQFPAETLGSAEGLELLRIALLAEAKAELGDDVVSAVLITGFLMT